MNSSSTVEIKEPNNLANEIKDPNSFCDEDQVINKQKEYEKQVQEIQNLIQDLEKEIDKMVLKKNQSEIEFNYLKDETYGSAAMSELNQEQKKLIMLQAKIEYIQSKIQNNNSQNNPKLEQEIAGDSAYLKILLQQKNESIKIIRGQIEKLRPIQIVQNNLQNLYQELEASKSKLLILKSTQFTNTNSNYREIYETMIKRLEELKLKQEKMDAIREEIKIANSSLNQQKDRQLKLRCKLKLLESIYIHYENQCEQQKTIIKNLKNEI